MARKLE
jgi:hypothetical protein